MSLASFQRKVNTSTEDEKGQPEEEQETRTLVLSGSGAYVLKELSRRGSQVLWSQERLSASVD